MVSNCEIMNSSKGKLPRLPFVKIKNAILGRKYELSIAFITPKESRKLNRTFRKIDSPTNILSFSYSKTSGEIVFEPGKIKAGSKDFGTNYRQFLKLLLIHGCLHLKGFQHNAKMEREETKWQKKFQQE